MTQRRRLGEILVSEAILAADVVERALKTQAQGGRRRLGQVLVDSGALEPAWLTAALALQAGVATVDPLALEVDSATLWRVPPDVAERTGSFVGRDADGLVVVVQDPSNDRAARSLAGLLGVAQVRIAAGLPDRVASAIARHYDTTALRARRLRGLVGEERPAVTSPTSGELDARVMLGRLNRQGARTHADFASALLVFAVESGAERLCVDTGKVTIAWDGVEKHILDLPATQAHGITTRLRTLLRLDAGGNRPTSNDGEVKLGESAFEVCARSHPGPSGGRVEARLIASDGVINTMNPRVAAAWRGLMAAPGIVVVAIPPGGDGLEPPETPVRVERRALTDRASVEAAVRAAESGRTVLATITAPGVVEGLARLRDLAPSRSAFAAMLTGALAARRLRRACPTCSQPAELDQAGAERLGVVPFAAPRPGSGCPSCAYLRYRGSVWCYELVVASQPLRDAIDTGAPISEIGHRALPLAERALQVDAVSQAILGMTTGEELQRCIPPRPAWAQVAPDERHRGLIRAVTNPGAESVDDPRTNASAGALPAILLVHPGDAAAAKLRAALSGRADVAAAGSAAAARTPGLPGVPAVGVLARWPRGGWDAELIAEWQALGMRVVLLGVPGDLDEMSAAFALNVDEYAGSIEEVGVRLARWLPGLTSSEAPNCNFG